MYKLAFFALFLTGCAGKSIDPAWFHKPRGYEYREPVKETKPTPPKKAVAPVAVAPPKRRVEETSITPIVEKKIIDHEAVFKQRMRRYEHCMHYERLGHCVRPRRTQ